MTLKDFIKRVDVENEETLEKMIIFSDGIGWTNVDVKETDNTIVISKTTNSPFTNDN